MILKDFKQKRENILMAFDGELKFEKHSIPTI